MSATVCSTSPAPGTMTITGASVAAAATASPLADADSPDRDRAAPPSPTRAAADLNVAWSVRDVPVTGRPALDREPASRAGKPADVRPIETGPGHVRSDLKRMFSLKCHACRGR